MTDLTTLRDAFTELERRADAHVAAGVALQPPRRTEHPRRRPVLVGATVTAMLAGVTGATLVALGPDRHGGTAGPASTPTASYTELPLPRIPTASSSVSAPPASTGLPTDVAALTERLGAILDDLGLGSVVVTSSNTSQGGPPGGSSAAASAGAPSAPSPDADAGDDGADPAVAGVLTSSAGVRGGFDAQVVRTEQGSVAGCEVDSDSCRVSVRPDGSSLAIGHSGLLGADSAVTDARTQAAGVTVQVTLVRTDGVEILLHLSNQQDPKGMSPVLSPEPPLTDSQLTAVVTSSLWGS